MYATITHSLVAPKMFTHKDLPLKFQPHDLTDRTRAKRIYFNI